MIQKKNIAVRVVMCITITLVVFASGDRVLAANDLDPGYEGWETGYEYIDLNTTWHKTDNLVFDKPVLIDGNATLTIEAGATVRLNGGDLTVNYGNIVAEGAQDDPIEFSSDNGAPFTIVFVDYEEGYEGSFGKTSLLRHVRVVGGGSYVDPEDCGTTGYWKSLLIDTAYAAAGECAYGTVAMRYISGRVDIDHASFVGNHYADVLVDGEFSEYNRSDFLNVSNTNFGDNTQRIAVLSQAYCSEAISHDECASKVVLRNNWWGDMSGPFFETSAFELPNTDGIGNGIIGDGALVFSPWATSRFNDVPIADCVENCFSNVLFLPGIKSSRLYQDGAFGTEDKLWLPNAFGNDLKELALDADGKSINDVYAKDVMSEALFPWDAGINLYKSFLGKLDSMKADHTINDYRSFAYDWRQNVEDIARDGTPYPEGLTESLTADLDALAQSSKSGKVTIIAHSNGGLLAKALMLELEASGQSDKVDKIVFVGTPQIGTPLSILSLLYGYDESLLAGALISREDARVLAENMPGAYGLLPSETYFDRMNEVFIRFSSENTRYKKFKDIYGDAINSFDELKSFLAGSGDGRVKPAPSDVESENTLNAKLLAQARDMHRRLDAWTPPVNVEVIQIAGWGLDTVSGVEYVEKEKTSCHASPSGGVVPSCTGIGEFEPVYDPKFTVDGDEVVTAPSALMLSEASNVRRYWANLYDYNDISISNKEHKDLLEMSDIQQFLLNIVTQSENLMDLPEFLKTSRPSDYNNAKPRLRMSLYSPLDIHLYDSSGHHTGPKKVMVDGKEQTIIETTIPNSYYYQFGERKYVGFGEGEPIRVEMDGYDSGSYTLKLEEVKLTEIDEETVVRTTFENLLVTPETKVILTVPETGLADLAPLEADIDGDGAKDYVVAPIQNGTATLDTMAPETSISISGAQGKNGWLTSDATVSLLATDNEGGSGVENISYSLDNGTKWQISTDPIVFSQEGITTIRYFATDKQGNNETVKTVEVRIDKTAPEAKIGFDPTTQKLSVTGMDNLSLFVSATIVESSVANENDSKYGKLLRYLKLEKKRDDEKIRVATTLTDEAGHITTVTLLHDKDKDRRMNSAVESVAYDGVVTTLSGINFQYKWQFRPKKNTYAMLASRLRSGSDGLESHYRPKKNVTVIMQKPQDLDESDEDDESEWRPVKKTLPGMVVPYLLTDHGRVTIGYDK